jgi:DNA-binding LacI/PurR family transcriptional regulator
MPVTLRDVARLAGVSASAVSRTYTPGASVAPETRARVIAAADTLGYLPNRLASGLMTGRTGLVGLIADDFGNPFFLAVLDHFTRALQGRGLRPLLINLSGEDRTEGPVRMLREYSVDAAILISSTLPAGFAAAFRAAGIPLVQAFARPRDEPDLSVAAMDDVAAGRLAAQTLRAAGYQRAAFLGGPPEVMPSRDRLAGFLAGWTGPGAVAVLHAESFSFEGGRAVTAAAFAATGADAVFAADDNLALGAMAAVRAMGLRVPEDVGLVGVNDIPAAGWPGLDLTTIAHPLAELVAAAVGLVQALIADPARPPEAVILPPRLVVRTSATPP